MSTQVFVEVDGEKLRRLRKRRVWLIGDLARESGVHRNVISKLENSRGGACPGNYPQASQGSRRGAYRASTEGVTMPLARTATAPSRLSSTPVCPPTSKQGAATPSPSNLEALGAPPAAR